MSNKWQDIPLGKAIKHRKNFVLIDDTKEYKRCRVQLHAQGIVLRDTVPGIEIKTKKQQPCKKDDFLVAEIDAKVGGYGIVSEQLAGAIVSSHYFLYDIDKNQLLPEYLGLYIKTEMFHNQVTAQGSTNYAAIRPEQVLEYKIPLPPLADQRRIVEKIGKLNEKILFVEELKRQIDNQSNKIMDSVINRIFSDIKGKEVKLVNLSTKIGSGSTPLGGRASYASEGIPFVRSMNVRMRYFQWEDIAYIDRSIHDNMEGTKVKPNDVLLNITGASIGRVACAPEDMREANVNQHVAIIRPTQELNPKYLMYYLSQPKIQEHIITNQKGATRQGFTKKQIEEIAIPIISPSEQEQITTYLDDIQKRIFGLVRLNEATIKEISALMPAILNEVFSG